MKGGFQNYAPPPFHSPTPLDDWGGGVGMEGHTICRHEKSPITATNFRRVERGGDITTSSYFFHASAADTPPRERNGRLKNTRPLHTPPKGKFFFPPPPFFLLLPLPKVTEALIAKILWWVVAQLLFLLFPLRILLPLKVAIPLP